MSAAVVRPARRAGTLAALWIIAYFGARVALESMHATGWQRVAVALAPVPLFAAFLWSWVGLIRTMDEMLRRIHLEALAIAFSLSALLLTTLALMQRAAALPPEDWSYAHVWVYLPIFYFLSLGFVSARYTRT